jgi:hypothetical protein
MPHHHSVVTQAHLQHATDFCRDDSSLSGAGPSETHVDAASTKDTRLALVCDDVQLACLHDRYPIGWRGPQQIDELTATATQAEET